MLAWNMAPPPTIISSSGKVCVPRHGTERCYLPRVSLFTVPPSSRLLARLPQSCLTNVRACSQHYAPLTRPTSAPAVRAWRPATTSTGRVSVEMSAAFQGGRAPAANPRYAHVEAKTDSGPNMRKVEDRFGITSARYKRTEVFRRIKPEKLALELRAGTVDDVLILDLREKDEFEAFRVRGAHNYPASMMSRSMYQFTPEILEFKNKEGKLMVLYDLEEKLSVAVACNWYEKGIDNFVVMSGGALALARTHPDLIDGALPMHLISHSQRGTRRPATASSQVGQRQPLAIRQPAAGARFTSGISSVSCAPRSIPRPVQWNGLRESAQPAAAPNHSSFGYSRSFDSR